MDRIVNDMRWENVILSNDWELKVLKYQYQWQYFGVTALLRAYTAHGKRNHAELNRNLCALMTIFVKSIAPLHLWTLYSSVPFIQIYNDLIRNDFIGFCCHYFATTSAHFKQILWSIITNHLTNNWWFMMKCRPVSEWNDCGFLVWSKEGLRRWLFEKISFKLTCILLSTRINNIVDLFWLLFRVRPDLY